MASNLLPVHISTLSNADAVYEKHAGQELLKVREGAAVLGFRLQVKPGEALLFANVK